MILSFHVLVTVVLFLYAFEDVYIYNFLSYFFWLAPFISFIIILTAVILTQIPVQIYRFIIIQTARLKIRNSKTIFIGIVGSYGKTTIAQYLYAMLSDTYAIAMTDPRYTNDIGIARAILRKLSDDTEIFIIEVSSFKKGELAKATHYIPFSYLIITGIGNHRFDLFGSKEKMHEEFTSLIPKLPADATVYLPSEIPKLKNADANIVTFGFEQKNDIYPTQYFFNQTYTKARIHYKKHSWNITTALLGKHSLQNLLPVFAICTDFDMKSSEIIHKISNFKHKKGFFSVHRGIHKSVVILDSQEPNFDALLSKLDFLRYFSQKRKYIICAGLQELGVEKRRTYEQIIHKLNKNNLELYTTDPIFKDLTKESRVITFNDVSQLQKQLILNVDKGTVVLVEGKWPPSLIEALNVHK